MAENRVALITGAAGDIGRAIAADFAADGWHVALHDHPSRRDMLDALDVECRARAGTCSTHLFDIAAADLADQIDRCIERCGIPFALVNAAGVQGAFSPIQSYPAEDVG